MHVIVTCRVRNPVTESGPRDVTCLLGLDPKSNQLVASQKESGLMGIGLSVVRVYDDTPSKICIAIFVQLEIPTVGVLGTWFRGRGGQLSQTRVS